MKIDVTNPQTQTLIFLIIFFCVLFLTARRAVRKGIFDQTLTNELKGFAMLAIIFSHIGYFLSNQSQFLYPLSIMAGVGVDIFLFLSGFGLTISSLQRPLGIFNFYKKRLTRLFLPMWIVLVVFLLLDFLILNKTYPINTIIYNFFGFFPRANLFLDIDSPLWYFTLILFYYLVFPILFNRRFPIISAFLFFLVGYLVTKQALPVQIDLLGFYKLHLFAFPYGVLFALLINKEHNQLVQKIKSDISKRFLFLKPLKPTIITIVKILILIFFINFAYHSGVGEGINIERKISLLETTLIVLIFISKRITFRFFEIFGKYSYEIYLIHWPILYRYDFLYKNLDASIATLLYLGLFLGLAFLLYKLVDKISTLLKLA